MIHSQDRKKNHYLLKRVIRRVLVDSLVAIFAYTAALLCFYLTHDMSLGLERHISWFLVGAVVVSSYVIVNAILGFYQRIWGSGSVMEPFWVLVSAGGTTVLLYELSRLLFSTFHTFDALAVTLIGGVLTGIGFLGVRYRLFIWRRLKQTSCPPGIKPSRVLIVGMTSEAQQLAMHLDQDELHRFKIVGFIDHNPVSMHMVVGSWSVLGEATNIPRIVKEESVDVILIVQSGLTNPDMKKLLSVCQETAAQIKILPDGLDVLNNRHWDLSILRDVAVEDLLEREQVEVDKTLCREAIAGKVVMVTGASGSIGSELCRQISTYAPARLIVLDNNESALHDLGIELQRNLAPEQMRIVLGDITHAAKMKLLFETEKPQIIFHAAAYKHVPMMEIYPEEAVRVNILGTMILSEYAARYDVERFIFISTDKAVNPSSVMGASKRVCELWLAALNHITARTAYTVVRFGNVIGSRGSVVPIFKRQIEWGGPVTVTHPEMTRYFMSIPEAVNLVLHSMTLGKQSATYMLDMGEQISVLELVQRMIRLRGLRVNRDIPIMYTGIRPGEKLHEELSYNNEARQLTEHPRIYRLKNGTGSSELKVVLGAILLLADAAQRQNLNDPLRHAIMAAAREDWDGFMHYVVDMRLLDNYQLPILLQGYSLLLDKNVIQAFTEGYAIPQDMLPIAA